MAKNSFLVILKRTPAQQQSQLMVSLLSLLPVILQHVHLATFAIPSRALVVSEQQARLNMKPNSVLKHTESRLSLHGEDEKEQKLWIHTVPKEIVDSVSDKEKKRQEVICELIYTERDFVMIWSIYATFGSSRCVPPTLFRCSTRVIFTNRVWHDPRGACRQCQIG